MELGLREGLQTKITSRVKREANKIKGKGLYLIANIIRYIHQNYKIGKVQHRTRTVDEIIKSKLMSGCTDFAHLFIALCRAKRIPALYIETFKKEWLKKPSKPIQGHIFVEIRIGKNKYIVDPTSGTINILEKIIDYEILAKGLDYKTLFPTRSAYIKAIKEKFKTDSNLLNGYYS